MSSHRHWARIVEAVARPHTVPSPEDRAELLQTALALGPGVVPDLVGCSVTQAVDTDTGTDYRTPVASNALALALDHAQYVLDDGPCVAACRDGQSHSVAVMDDESEFADFTAAALDHGVHSSLSLPLVHSRPSAINLYAGGHHAFADDRARAAAAFLARCVGGLLPDASPPAARPEPTSTTAQRRELIERACAAVAKQEGCEPDRAFHQLTVLSRTQQRSIFEVARSLVGAGERS